MAGTNGNGSYQKSDGGGNYTSIPNGSGQSQRKTRLYVIGGVALVVLLAILYEATTRNASAKAVNKVLTTDGNVHVEEDGTLKLFDQLSAYLLVEPGEDSFRRATSHPPLGCF